MSFFNWLLTTVAGFVWSKLAAFIIKLAEVLKRQQQIKKQADTDSQPAEKITPADPAEKVDEAIDDELKHI